MQACRAGGSASSGLPRKPTRPPPFALRTKPIITASERELREVSRSRRNTDLLYSKKKPGRGRAFRYS
jgi:hypothetical protein